MSEGSGKDEASAGVASGTGTGSLSAVSAESARHRRRALRIVGLCVLVLLPWTVYLALSLPDQFQARHWSAAWVGFDVLLLASLAGAGVAVWRRLQILIPLSLVAGTLLVCDAWFDISLDWGTRDVWGSVASAFLVELPLAFLLFLRARRLFRITVRLAWERLGLTDEPPPLYRLPLFSTFTAAVSGSDTSRSRSRSGP
jgi:hypothetical protein